MKSIHPIRQDILSNLCQADLIQFNDDVLRPDYLLIPDESSSKDDILLECTGANGQAFDLTLDELNQAQYLGDGAYLVKHRGMIRFLQMAAVR